MLAPELLQYMLSSMLTCTRMIWGSKTCCSLGHQIGLGSPLKRRKRGNSLFLVQAVSLEIKVEIRFVMWKWDLGHKSSAGPSKRYIK